MKKQCFHLLLLTCVVTSTLWLSSCQKETTEDTAIASTETTDRSPGNARVFPINANPYGQSYTAWSKVWLQEFLAYGCDDVPFLNPENVLFHTTGPVYMMAGIAEEGGSADVTIPRGKAVMFPLVNIWWNLCPGDEIPPNMTEEEFIASNLAFYLDFIDPSSLEITIDGSPVNNVPAYNVVTDVFAFAANPDLVNCIDPCVTGVAQNWAMGGYFMILKPLPPGQHTVHYHAEIPEFNAVQDATFNITVQ